MQIRGMSKVRLSIFTFISIFIKFTKHSPGLSTKRTSEELKIKYTAYCRAGPKQHQAEHTQKCCLMSSHLVCTLHLTGKNKTKQKKKVVQENEAIITVAFDWVQSSQPQVI